MRKLAFAPALAIVIIAAPWIAEPIATATRTEAAITAPLPLPPSVEFQTITDPTPHVINVARIPAQAAVDIKAVQSQPDSRGYMLTQPIDIGRDMGALLVINADFHLFNGVPIGGVVTDGQLIRPLSPKHPQLSLNSQRQFAYRNSGDIPADTVQSTGASYLLLQDGQTRDIPEHTAFTETPQARTIVGWNHYNGDIFFVTVDKGINSRGMTLAQAGQLLARLGATEAVNLDGGESTQFVVNGELRNAPSLGPHPVANFWVVLPRTP